MFVSAFREREFTRKSRLRKRKKEKEGVKEKRQRVVTRRNFDARKRTILTIIFFRHIARRTFQDAPLSPNFLFAASLLRRLGKYRELHKRNSIRAAENRTSDPAHKVRGAINSEKKRKKNKKERKKRPLSSGYRSRRKRMTRRKVRGTVQKSKDVKRRFRTWPTS